MTEKSSSQSGRRRTRRAARQPGARKEGRIITVFSPKGGTGKTVIATNLAAALSKAGDRRTLLLDLDLQFGDAAIMLGIEPEKTIFDFVNAPGELDPDKLAGYTTKHKSGLDILPAPLRPEDAELVTEAKLGRLIEVARATYDAIVVDTSPFFHGPMLATLDRTDELLLVCCLDVPTLKNVRLALGTLEMLSFPPARIRVVLNRANTKVGHEAARGRGGARGEGALRGASTEPCRCRSTRAPGGALGSGPRLRPLDEAMAKGSSRPGAKRGRPACARASRGRARHGLHDRLNHSGRGGRRRLAPSPQVDAPAAAPRSVRGAEDRIHHA